MRAALEEGLERARDEQRVFEVLCAVLTEVGRHVWAWVGRAEHDERRTVRPVALAGDGAADLLTTEVLWSASERGSGPTGTAIRTRVPCVIGRMAADPRATPWRDITLRNRLAEALSLPLVIDDELFGALTVFSREEGTFDHDEVTLLVGLVRSAAQVVSNLRARAAQRRSEVALLETERRFQLIFDSTQAFIALLSPDGAVQEINEATLRRADIDPAEARGRRFAELPHNRASAAEIDAAIARVARDRASAEVVIEAAFADGRAVLDCVFEPLVDDDEQVVAILFEASDITARRRAEEALRQSETRFRRMLDGGWDVVMLQDPVGRYLYVSGASERAVGRAPEVMMRMEPGEGIHPDDLRDTRRLYRAVLDTPDASRSFEMRFRHADGRWLWLQCVSVNLLHDPDVRAILTIARDITSRKETELALAASEQELRLIADHIRDMLWIVDPVGGRLVYVSPAYESIFGRPPPSYDVRFQDWLVVVDLSNVEEIRAAFMACNDEKKRVEMACRVRRPDGSVRHLRATASPVVDGGGRVIRIVGVTRDVTHERMARMRAPAVDARRGQR